MSGEVTEQELSEAAELIGASRVTLGQIEETIAGEYYFTAADGVDGADINKLRALRPDEDCLLGPLNDEPLRETTELAPLGLLTICVLRLYNGFTVHGVSACADPANFNENIGRRLAKQDAIGKMWALLGYELKTKLWRRSLTGNARVGGDALQTRPALFNPAEEDAPKPEWYRRLMIEERELSEKIDKLKAFLQSDNFKSLGPEIQALMRDQNFYMSGYHHSLKERIALLG